MAPQLPVGKSRSEARPALRESPAFSLSNLQNSLVSVNHAQGLMKTLRNKTIGTTIHRGRPPFRISAARI